MTQFNTDGPDVLQSKQSPGAMQQRQRKTESTSQMVTSNNPEHHQRQKKCQKDYSNAATAYDLSRPLHIIPSWQPLDANEKPPYSYATLIAHSLLSSDHRRLTLGDIYKWIPQHYPFYAMVEHGHGWKNSIRHNLSLNKAFVRVQRPSSTVKSGKGSFWTIRPGQELVFIENLIKRRGPLCKQPVILPPRSYHHHRSSQLGTDDNNSSTSITTVTNTCSINNSPLFTTFRMTLAAPPTDKSTKRKRSMPELRQSQSTNNTTIPAKAEVYEFADGYDSDCDSGIDVSNECDTSKDRRQRIIKPQLKKAKSSPCLFYDSLDNDNADMATIAPLNSTFQHLSPASLDFISPNWTDCTSLSPDSIIPPFLDWAPLDSTCHANTAYQNLLLSPTDKTAPSTTLDSAPGTIADTFSQLGTLTNDILPFENLASYDTMDTLPSSTCVDSFSMDDFLLDDQTLMADWTL